VALANGDLLCGTTVRGGTGGEVTADTAELFVVDMEARRVTWREPVECKSQGLTPASARLPAPTVPHVVTPAVVFGRGLA